MNVAAHARKPIATHVGVVGTGPVGLATAHRLAREGFRVTLFAMGAANVTRPDGLKVRETYHAAAAFWTPFCSGLNPAEERATSSLTLDFYRSILEHPEWYGTAETTGLALRTIQQHFLKHTLANLPEWRHLTPLQFRPSKRKRFRLFHRLPAGSHSEGESSQPWRTRCEFSYKAPVIQVDLFVPWYRRLVTKSQNVSTFEAAHPMLGPRSSHPCVEACRNYWRDLLSEHRIEHVVVCTGSGTVFNGLVSPNSPQNESFQPMKGVVAHLKIRPKRIAPVVLFEGGVFDRDTLYVVPLVSRYLLGGTVHPVSQTDSDSSWQVKDGEKRDVVDRAMCFLPSCYRRVIEKSGLASNPLSSEIEWRVGVRPMLGNHGPVVQFSPELTEYFSPSNHPSKTDVYVHYGHGGSGFTFCHDTAARVVEAIHARARLKDAMGLA